MIRLYLYDRVCCIVKACVKVSRIISLIGSGFFNIGKYSDLALKKVWRNNFQLNFLSNLERNDFKQVVLDPS